MSGSVCTLPLCKCAYRQINYITTFLYLTAMRLGHSLATLLSTSQWGASQASLCLIIMKRRAIHGFMGCGRSGSSAFLPFCLSFCLPLSTPSFVYPFLCLPLPLSTLPLSTPSFPPSFPSSFPLPHKSANGFLFISTEYRLVSA